MSWKRCGAEIVAPKSRGVTRSEKPFGARACAAGRRGRRSRPAPAAGLAATVWRRVSASGGTARRVALRAIPSRNRDCEREFRSGGRDDGGLVLGRTLAAQPLAAVLAHRVEDRQQRLALGGQRVLDARRYLGVGVALDDPFLFECAQ